MLSLLEVAAEWFLCEFPWLLIDDEIDHEDTDDDDDDDVVLTAATLGGW